MPEMKVSLEACEPMELMRGTTEHNVWFRRVDNGNYWPSIEIRGEQVEIWKYIAIHWDEETADAVVYGFN